MRSHEESCNAYTLSQNSTQMKKYIEISEETLAAINSGKYVEGSLRRDKTTGGICFRAYNRTSRGEKREWLICRLEHGWVKESPRRVKLFESLPKELGMRRMHSVLERELAEAESAIFYSGLL